MRYFAGLDVSLEETAICVVDETGRIMKELRGRRTVLNEMRSIENVGAGDPEGSRHQARHAVSNRLCRSRPRTGQRRRLLGFDGAPLRYGKPGLRNGGLSRLGRLSGMA